MRKLAVILIASGGLLSACVGYETPATVTYSTGNPSYGSGPYYTSDGRAYYNRDGRAYYYPSQDRDRDGTPDYRDRDRDGDGVRNSQDSRPDNPRRY